MSDQVVQDFSKIVDACKEMRDRMHNEAYPSGMFGAEPRGCSVGHARHPALLRHDSPLEGAGLNSRFPIRRNGGSDAMGRGGPIKSL